MLVAHGETDALHSRDGHSIDLAQQAWRNELPHELEAAFREADRLRMNAGLEASVDELRCKRPD